MGFEESVVIAQKADVAEAEGNVAEEDEVGVAEEASTDLVNGNSNDTVDRTKRMLGSGLRAYLGSIWTLPFSFQIAPLTIKHLLIKCSF